jgi:TetR/AcrR family transcriptional regulator, repressor for uid operon
VARRRLTLEVEPVVAGALDAGGPDAAGDQILDAAETFLRQRGLHRWTVEEVADRAGVGRTSVYRRFPSRDDLVHGVLARELRAAITAVGVAAGGRTTLDDAVVDAVLAALRCLEGSVVDALLRSDAATVLPLLTTGAGPLLAQARDAFAPGLVALGVATDSGDAAIAAEALARLGLSFVLTRDTVLPLDDPEGLRRAVRALLAPLLAARR